MIGHKGNREHSGIRRSATKGLRALLAVQVLLSAFVVFSPVVSAVPEDDWSEFVFVFDNGTIIAGHNLPGSPYVYPPDGGARKKNQAWFPGTGGSAGYPNGPGMDVHVSCSDTFENGWGTANQPNQAVDTNWRIASYHIVKYTNGSFTRECGETFTRSSIEVVKNTSPLTDDIFRFGLSGNVPAPPSGGNAGFGPDFRNVAGDGDSYTWTGLDAGSYSLVELVASNPGGYALAGVRCSSDLGADVSPDTDGVTLNLRGGENLTCEFLNTGSVPDEPGVDIEKATNGQDADVPTGPQVPVGGVVNWSYVVTNVGDVDLSGVTVEDDQGVVVSCPFDALAVGESMTCTASGTAAAGQYSNVGLVTTDQQVSDRDPSHYFGYIPTPNPPTSAFGSIGDFVWDDGLITESNGRQDVGEPGVPGITVNLFNGSGSVKLATTVTNASGGYVFTGLAAGTYVVEFMIPSDTLYSLAAANQAGSLTDSDADPLTRRTGVITLGVGEDDMSWDAGLVVPAVLPQVITTVATVGQTAETLPFTGSSSGDIAGLGLALLALGSLAILVVRRREDDQRVTGGGRPFSVAYRGRHRRY